MGYDLRAQLAPEVKRRQTEARFRLMPENHIPAGYEKRHRRDLHGRRRFDVDYLHPLGRVALLGTHR